MASEEGRGQERFTAQLLFWGTGGVIWPAPSCGSLGWSTHPGTLGAGDPLGNESCSGGCLSLNALHRAPRVAPISKEIKLIACILHFNLWFAGISFR